MIPPALKRLFAEVGASSGHSNLPRPKPVTVAFKPFIKVLKPILSR
jgi:hypothetical protein